MVVAGRFRRIVDSDSECFFEGGSVIELTRYCDGDFRPFSRRDSHVTYLNFNQVDEALTVHAKLEEEATDSCRSFYWFKNSFNSYCVGVNLSHARA